MRILTVDTAAAMALAAADMVADQLRMKPESVLALPTGSTPLGLYAELVRRSRLGDLRLAKSRIFNLDEYFGLAPSDPASYAAFLARHLIVPLSLPRRRRACCVVMPSTLRPSAATTTPRCAPPTASIYASWAWAVMGTSPSTSRAPHGTPTPTSLS